MPTAELLDDALVRWLRRLVWPLRRAAAQGGEGVPRGGRPGDTYRFLGHRPYSPGDDLRRVDWPAYARTDHPVVKVFAREEGERVVLAVDATASMACGNPPKLGTAVRLAAALGLVALASGHRVHLWVLAQGTARLRGPFAGAAGERGLVRALAALAAVGGGMPAALGALLRRLGRVDAVVLFTDGLDAVAGLVPRLGARAAAMDLFQVLSREELRPPWRGWRRLEDLETGAVRDLFLGPVARRRYEARLRARMAGLARACHRHGIRYHRVLTDRPLTEIVAAWYRGGR